MANSLFNMTVIGHLGRDVEIRSTASGRKVASFNVAANRSWTGSDGNKVEKTEWVRCSLWAEKLIEAIAQYLTKGRQVYVSGRPGASAYLGKDDNQPKASLELTVDQIQLLGAGNGHSDEPVVETEAEESIPF